MFMMVSERDRFGRNLFSNKQSFSKRMQGLLLQLGPLPLTALDPLHGPSKS